ncbi:aminotransferase class V-fold PLP-dependent enzyme [Allosaccharopolyspora coralli]|uniref:Aminotransferase class V-fold PLP-dependent enzyme n=1 Tax=Allosaccharopolyspora coralli TaxID=2665642 RepID=A0A5Q3Q4C8_9PSEU|nr:aminotransferase class V-fold PLP-dependent enzyme [Allosaccharopolyspora coralli]QGK68356.1 aminotransferase class V-fold PLP-dependent enzyme [Allosaccharopolyspora coralli]
MNSPGWASTRARAASWDDADALAATRSAFLLREGVLHCDGTGVRARTTGSGTAPDVLGRLASLTGATPDEIRLADSASMNTFATLLAATRLRPDRPVLLLDSGRAAADRYLARSAADFRGGRLHWWDPAEDLDSVVDEQVAVVSLSHTDPVSGGVRDAAAITARVHAHGALVVWDVTGSTGALDVALRDWDADFAVGCGHKFLGGGPDAPSFTMTARRHHDTLAAGPGDIGGGVPHPAARADNTLSTSGLGAGLAALEGIPPERLHAKTAGLVRLFLELLVDLPVDVVRPASGQPHGPHVTLRHDHARWLTGELFARGVLVDHVEPDLVRFVFAPAWLSYGDAVEAAETLHEVLAAGLPPGAQPSARRMRTANEVTNSQNNAAAP